VEGCIVSARTLIAAVVGANLFVGLAGAQNDLNPKSRQELKREDVPGLFDVIGAR
jgi:hypothetical protein